MKIEKCIKESFSVIGKEGSTASGQGFVFQLWQEANANFAQVQSLAKRDEKGALVGFWGVMSDFSRSFAPWEEGFSKGLYLAGVECDHDAQTPAGWEKWTIPGFEYIRAEVENENTFSEVLQFLEENNTPLAAAVHDFTCPKTGRNYMYFPIRKL